MNGRIVAGTATWRAAGAAALAFALIASAGGAATEAPAWPQTRAGELAKGWVAAFDAGEPAMRKFLAEGLAASSLAKKGVEARIETYRKLREQLGTLALAAVVQEDGDLLTVSLVDSEARGHEFDFELEPDPPHKLAAVTARLRVGHGRFPH